MKLSIEHFKIGFTFIVFNRSYFSDTYYIGKVINITGDVNLKKCFI